MANRERLTRDAARELHKEFMKDPEYAAKWNELTSQLLGFLADLPEDALPDSHEQDEGAHGP